MDVNTIVKDGDSMRPIKEKPILEAPSIGEVVTKPKLEGTAKKKRRRGKSKRKVMKTYVKPWQDRRRNDKTKRNNRFRKIVLAKTHAPFNNNQFLMEIHKPEPENSFHVLQTPSARTRDSSFSVDSEDNYFFSLPDNEEEYLTKEFSSVYEDAQTERLSNMSKNELIQEYLLLEAKYDNLVRRSERCKPRYTEDEKSDATEKDTSVTDRDSMIIERDTSATSVESSAADEPSIEDIMQRLKEQEEQICELKLANEKLHVENEHFRKRCHSSSEDSESDSSSTSMSSSSSSSSMSPNHEPVLVNGDMPVENIVTNGQSIAEAPESSYPLVNGFHDSMN